MLSVATGANRRELHRIKSQWRANWRSNRISQQHWPVELGAPTYHKCLQCILLEGVNRDQLHITQTLPLVWADNCTGSQSRGFQFSVVSIVQCCLLRKARTRASLTPKMDHTGQGSEHIRARNFCWKVSDCLVLWQLLFSNWFKSMVLVELKSTMGTIAKILTARQQDLFFTLLVSGFMAQSDLKNSPLKQFQGRPFPASHSNCYRFARGGILAVPFRHLNLVLPF